MHIHVDRAIYQCCGGSRGIPRKIAKILVLFMPFETLFTVVIQVTVVVQVQDCWIKMLGNRILILDLHTTVRVPCK